MTPQVERIHRDASVHEAAQKMKTLDIGMVPVYDGDRLVGMITDRDIALRVVAEGRDATQTPVYESMTGEVTYCFESQTVEEAAKIMEKHKIRRLIVLNRDKRLVGIVSLGDLATHRKSQKAAREVLEIVSKVA
jgi:CBS domain-containing protein